MLFVHCVQKEDTWNFKQFHDFFPDPIGNVVNLPIPVAYVYPPLANGVNAKEIKRRKKALKKVGYIVADDENQDKVEPTDEERETPMTKKTKRTKMMGLFKL